MNKIPFGCLPTGEQAYLYTIQRGSLTAKITDFGATLVSLLVPDRNGNMDDVLLGFDDISGYAASTAFIGAIVGRNANRIKGASFPLGGRTVRLAPNEGSNNLHSGPDCFHTRLWTVTDHQSDRVTLRLESPHMDQGFPGNAVITVTYLLDSLKGLHIRYEGVSDRDTVFNLTNHAYFNLAGHHRTGEAMEQYLSIPGRFFTADDAENIPTGELRDVAGTPMDFRKPKRIGRDIEMDYDALKLQGGYDHNYEVFCNPCAILSHSASGRTMAVYTDCPGIQLYAGNYLNEENGKGGVVYGKRSGVALETQFYPDSLNHPQWKQPVTPAGEPYFSETVYRFD